jgi:hypothetical protein
VDKDGKEHVVNDNSFTLTNIPGTGGTIRIFTVGRTFTSDATIRVEIAALSPEPDPGVDTLSDEVTVELITLPAVVTRGFFVDPVAIIAGIIVAAIVAAIVTFYFRKRKK